MIAAIRSYLDSATCHTQTREVYPVFSGCQIRHRIDLAGRVELIRRTRRTTARQPVVPDIRSRASGELAVPSVSPSPVVRGGEDSIMEVQILLDGGVFVRGAVHPIGRGANSLQFGVRGVADQTLDGQFLQPIPQAVELVDVLGRQRVNGGAAVPLGAHQAFALQAQQRFADRAATHPQHRRQLDLAQRRTGCVDTGVDRFSHAVSDLIGHPASSHRERTLIPTMS